MTPCQAECQHCSILFSARLALVPSTGRLASMASSSARWVPRKSTSHGRLKLDQHLRVTNGHSFQAHFARGRLDRRYSRATGSRLRVSGR